MSSPDFIETSGSLDRVNNVLNAILSGNYILLEGETGTSKTRTAIEACLKNNQPPIVLNFSSQTTIEDLIGRITKDTDSWGGFSFAYGPYTKAFKEGRCLILDEINLAYENVVQCIEASLDSGKLFLENEVVKKHPNFHLIATQNPLTGRFSQKRQFLSSKFRSLFQIINFVEIEKEELLEIAMGLSKNSTISCDTIENLINFHFEWKQKAEEENQIHVFTIREISGTIKSMKEGISPFQSILVHYGSRYSSEKLKDMINTLAKHGFTPSDENLPLPPIEDGLFYMNQTILRPILNSIHLLQTCHPILVTGPDGCGKTSFARWISKIYNNQMIQNQEEEEREISESTDKEEQNNDFESKEIEEISKEKKTTELPEQEDKTKEQKDDSDQKEATESPEKEDETKEQKDDSDQKESTEPTEQDDRTKEQKDKSEQKETKEQNSSTCKKDLKKLSRSTNVFICNPEVSISDIIGRYMPVMGAVGEAPIMWIDGPVVKSLRNGDCLIMDQIDMAPSTILERMNPIYDSFGIKDAKFSVQENSEEDSVPIHPNARIIATSTIEGLSDISPALLNRFTIVYIDDQLNELFRDKENFINFISFLSPKSTLKSDIKLISEIIIKNRTEMTMSRISTIVKGFYPLKKAFPRAISKSVLEFCESATSNTVGIPRMDENFISLLLDSLKEDNTDTTFDTFLFKEAEATRKIMAVLVAASIAGFHVVLIGKTGLGKTSAAIALSRLSKFSKGRQFISFNGETQLEELFGFFTIEKGQFTSHAGPLSDAMEKGKYFIADELNLADQLIIQSLNVAIEPSKNEEIILPVIGKNIIVNENFFFIGCQNDISMYGRKPLPESFKKRVLCINYPENSYRDLHQLTKSLAQQFNLDSSFAKGVTDMIEAMKKDPIFKKKIWSLREVRKLYRRTQYILNQTKSMNGFSIHTNAAFLLRSAFTNIEGISNRVAELIKKSFNLNNNEFSILLRNLDSDVRVMKINPKSQVQLNKNKLSLLITNSELLNVPEGLQSFWKTLFEVSITHPSEPLLLVGPPGFKTFLAEMVSPCSPVVYLHSDTTISSLIGQITLLDKNQARQFLLDSLSGFAGPAPKDEFLELFKEIRESEVIDIEKIREVIKYVNNPSFTNIVENVIQQLIDIDYSQLETTSAFSNYLSIFKPGLITKYILKQNSLILKNIAQPSPTVLERLNELLSVTPTLTLFEDTSNTFTTSNNNILSQFSNNFRMIGICLPREKRGLSDAMQSRLTEISVPEYTNEDQEKVIDSILLQSELNNDKSINLYKKLLSKVSQIFIDEKEKLSMSIPFIKIIEMVRIAISWRTFFNKYEKVESEESLFSLALLRSISGSLPFNNKKLFIDTFYNESSGLTINKELKKLYEGKTDEEIVSNINDFLIIDEEEDQRIIRSTLSNCFIPTPLNKLLEFDFCITPSIKDMIDVIISASMINYPLILEGPNGSGKSSSFFYLAKCVDANVVRISISSSTTVDDLFGKYQPNTNSDMLKFDFQPTNFLNAIRSDRNLSGDTTNDDFSSLKKQWIIIEELHLASASVLDSLAPVFNKQANQIVLTDGTVIAKGDYFIVGLISQPLQNQSIINTSMVYKTRDYTKSEYEHIYKFVLSKHDFDNEISSYFSDQMFILSSLSATSQFKVPVTAREVHKFLNLFVGSEGKIEFDKIIRTLCLGRFTDNEFIVNAKEELGYNDDNYKLPEVTIEMGSLSLISGGIPMPINPSTTKRHYDVQYLTSSEKELFVFLSMTMKKYTPVIIQGPTASGKTYSIQLYSDIIGKQLRIIQLNSEITSQIIAGTFQPSNNLSYSEMEELREALQSISDLPNLPLEFSNKLENEDINNWTPKDFKSLRLVILKSIDQFNLTDQEKAQHFIKKVDNLLQFYNHLKRIDSVIIKAMVEGDWLLLDGIEAAPSDFFDRLYTLIDDRPSLNLYERGNGFTYSYDSLNPEHRIHPDFRLIMTYNPVDISSANLSTSLLSRCSIYSMNSIDNNINDSSLVIFGFLNQIDFNYMDEESSELSIKLGKVHMAAKKISFNSQFSITGRTLIHLCNNLEYRITIEKIDFPQLKNIINFNYGSLMNNPSEFIEDVDEIFKQVIDVKFLEFIKKAQLSTSKSCIEIINLIDNYINAIKENIGKELEFDKFLGLLLQLHLKDIETVYDKVHYTLINSLRQFIIDIKSKETRNNPMISNFINHCSSIRCLEILVNDIHVACQESSDNEFLKNATLCSPQVQDIPKFKIILKKIRCLILLIQKKIFVSQSLPILFNDNSRNDFLSILEKLDQKKPFNELLQSIKQLYNNENARLFINFQENPIYFLDSMIHFHVSNNWPDNLNSTSKMIASCLFFNHDNCKFFFRGISKDFYLVLQSLLNNELDLNHFIDLVDYVDIFYDLLEINPSINLDEFSVCFDQRSNSDQQKFKKYFQNLRTINNKSPFQSEPSILNEFEPIQKIVKLIDALYQDYNKKYSLLYLQRQKDQDAAKEFYQLIENINNRLETEDEELKIPLRLYVNLTYDIDINAESFAFLKQIYSTIKVPKEIKVNTFEWPKDSGIKFSTETPSYPLMDSLINYSKKAQLDFQKANWMTLCSIEKNAEHFLEQFINHKISQESIDKYHTTLKANLLYDLFIIGSDKNNDNNTKFKYCSREAIINFLNENNNRSSEFNQTFVDLAHYYELNMDRNFVINIPKFDTNDIIALLFNPIDQSPGPLFNSTKVTHEDHQFLEKFYTKLIERNLSLFDLAMNYLYQYNITGFDESQSFDDIYQYVVSKGSIDMHIQDVIRTLFNAHQIAKIALKNNDSIKLQFNDIPTEFNESFIDKNPFSGFYLCVHQEAQSEISLINSLIGDSSYPLSLFAFRQYSQQRIIEIKLPSTFLSNLSHEVEDFIKLISEIIIKNINNGKITKFSYLIGFLLNQAPLSLNTQQSEHFREIILDAISKRINPILVKYIMNYLNNNIEKMILLVGSDRWNQIIRADFTKTKDEFLLFLINPWGRIMQSIKSDFETEKKKYSNKIVKLFDTFNNNFTTKYNRKIFFKKVFDAKRNDEVKLQSKIREDYIRKNNEQIDQDAEKNQKLYKSWRSYCSYVKNALNQFKDFPGISNNRFQYSDFYYPFYEHLKTYSSYSFPTSDEITTLLIIIPKEELIGKEIRISYTKGKEKIDIPGVINKISIIKLPQDVSISALNLSSNDADLFYENVLTEKAVEPRKEFKMKDMIDTFDKFKDLLGNKDDTNDDHFGKITVTFNKHSYEDFQKEIEELENEIKAAISTGNKLKLLSESSTKILSKIKKIEDFFPARFPDEVEVPKETNSSLEQFKDFISQFDHDLKEINISQELISADDLFIINKNSDFNNILASVDRFDKSPNPRTSKETTQYSKEEMSLIKSYDKLIVPTIFADDNTFILNINHLHIQLGPYYKGAIYSELRIKIINLTKEKISCVYHQDDAIADLYYENEDGFFSLVFPLDKLTFDYNCDSEIHFSGKIEFFEPSSEAAFKEITYNISLLFISPNIFFKVSNYSLAIKDGEAEILPYYAIQNSNLIFESLPASKQVKLIELPENTAKKPSKLSSTGKYILTFPYKSENQDYFAAQLDFGLSNSLSVPISLNLDLKENELFLAVYCDKGRDFVQNGAKVSVGNLCRDVYILISYFNPLNKVAEAKITFPFFDSKTIEIKTNKKIEFPAYSQTVEAYSFEVMLSDIPNERMSKDCKINVQIDNDLSATSQFEFLFEKIFFDKKRNQISTNKLFKNCSYWDGSKFANYTKRDEYNGFDYNILVSPVNYFFSQTFSSNLATVKYDSKGEYFKNQPFRDIEFEVLMLDPKAEKENQIIIINTYRCHQREGRPVNLFARIKGKPSTVFPLFGRCNCPQSNFDISLFDNKENIITGFLEWMRSISDDLDKNLLKYEKGKDIEITDQLPSSLNYSYLVHRLTPYLRKLEYFEVLIPKICEFTNSNMLSDKYNAAKEKVKKNDINFKFIMFIWALYETMNSLYDSLRFRNFTIDLPIPFEKILDEQKSLLTKYRLDESNAKASNLYLNKKRHSKIEEYNSSKITSFTKEGFSISSYAKWTFENKFQAITEGEFLTKEDIIHPKYTNEIKPEYSNELGTINIPDVSFDNMNSIYDTYKAFDSILKNAYQFTISIHSCLLKKDSKQINHNVEILNQLVSFFLWAKEIKDYSPYPSFFNRFFSAYQSMISRLKLAGMSIRKDHSLDTNLLISKKNDFVNSPEVKTDFELIDWKQLGKNKKPKEKENVHVDLTQGKKSRQPLNKHRSEEIEEIDFTKYTGHFTKTDKNSGTTRAEINKKMSRTSEEIEEVPNKDYIDYIVNRMINPGKEKITISVFDDDKTHIPENYEIDSEVFHHINKVDYFFEQAETLTASILNDLNQKTKVLDNCDHSYASILIDCSNTFSIIQKASLILLTIAYGNALTALCIPYSIVIFCDDNFQFILKKLEDQHERIHFLRLIEAMTVNRRMASMTDAIQMAKLKILPSKNSPYSNRTNHVIYTLSDGLSTSLNSIKQWREKVLNSDLVTVSFFFLNIISGEINPEILGIWSKFAIGISQSDSPTTLFYSSFENIIKNKDFFNVLQTQNSNDDSLIKLVTLSDCFSEPLIQSVPRQVKKSTFKSTKKLERFDFVSKSVPIILDNLYYEVSTESKYYKDNSFNMLAYEPLEIEIPSTKIEPFSVILSLSDLNEREIYNSLYNEFTKLTSTMVEQSNVQEMSSFVFIPNKPSQYAPSSNGTLFYFPGLIRFLLTQGQDTKIFLEKKAGLTKSYSVFVIIDCTTSCFNIQSSYHAFQSIFVLLQTIAKIDLPSFNLIITTNEGPLVLCSEKSTFDALSQKSPIWVTLFSYLSNPHQESCLDSALLHMLALRSQEKTLSSILFMFTDGNISTNKQKVYNSILESISNYNVETVTIGIGSISSNINSFGTRKVWSPNPRNIIKAILAAFGKETSDLIHEITSLYKITLNQEDEVFKNIELNLSAYLEYNTIDDYLLKDLVTELNSITREISVFTDFYNIQPDGSESLSEESSHDIGKKNFYTGISILICQFWDESMSYNENEYISKEVLINGTDSNHISVINALNEFGISSKIVQNYKDAIDCIKSGEYSQVWVICGRYDGRMPDKSNTANLMFQFIEVLIKYWELGGGLVFWTDNSPLDAEVNFFLSEAKFENDEKVKFRIGGSYPGCNMLKKSEKPKKSSFKAQTKISCDGYDKLLFNANMKKIYEGITIASAIIPPKKAKNECYDDPNNDYEFAFGDDIYPFEYFSISSSGGVSSMYYNSPLNSQKGDIVIDCGFSKLFFELTTEGIYYYVRNIAIFMLSLEKKSSMIGGSADPRKYKPKKFDYLVRPYANPNPGFYLYNEERAVDIVFLIDGTGSMRFLIEAVINSCNDIAQVCKEKFSENTFRFGCIIYRDTAVKTIRNELNNYRNPYNDETEYSPLNKNIDVLSNFLYNVEPSRGGNDGPEDWVSGYTRLKKMNWSKTSEKVVIHIADAPAHGYKFNHGNYSIPYLTSDESINKEAYLKMDNEQEKELIELIKWSAKVNIRFFGISGGDYPYNSFNTAKYIYDKAGGLQYNITTVNNYSRNIGDKQRRELLKIVKKVALQSVDAAVAVKRKLGLNQDDDQLPASQRQQKKQQLPMQPILQPPPQQPKQKTKQKHTRSSVISNTPPPQTNSKKTKPAKPKQKGFVPSSTYFKDDDDDE